MSNEKSPWLVDCPAIGSAGAGAGAYSLSPILLATPTITSNLGKVDCAEVTKGTRVVTHPLSHPHPPNTEYAICYMCYMLNMPTLSKRRPIASACRDRDRPFSVCDLFGIFFLGGGLWVSPILQSPPHPLLWCSSDGQPV